MAKRLTIEQIKNKCKENGIIFKKIDGEYKNQNEENIICECIICKKEYNSSLLRIKKGTPVCKDCVKQYLRNKFSFKYEDVKKYIEEYGFTLIDENYENAHKKMNIICNVCGENFKISFNNFQKEKHKCPKCSYKARAEERKFDKGFVEFFINNAGYELIGDYINCDTKMDIKCDNGHIFKMNFYDFKNRNRRCPECYKQKDKSGKNSPSWKGGITPLSNHLRGIIDDWKRDSFKKYNYECCITHTKEDLIIHHIYSFNTIIEECLSYLNLNIKPISEYSQDELKKIEDLCVELHYKYGLGVCICKEVHNKFHSIYGKGNNTSEQWDEFIKKYY